MDFKPDFHFSQYEPIELAFVDRHASGDEIPMVSDAAEVREKQSPSVKDTLMRKCLPLPFRRLASSLKFGPSKRLKLAVWRTRLDLPMRISAYLLPVGLSFGILQLSFRQIYWGGARTTSKGSMVDPQKTNDILAVLQIVAKLHDIMVIVSLSHLVLHYLRQELCSDQGIPYGLFTSAYGATFGTPPISSDFWHSCRSTMRWGHVRWRPIGLGILVILSTCLGLAADPASAVALIPRNEWWHYGDLFWFSQNYNPQDADVSLDDVLDFTMYIPTKLFPIDVGNGSLPLFNCLSPDLDIDGLCPWAGLAELLPALNGTHTSEIIHGSEYDLLTNFTVEQIGEDTRQLYAFSSFFVDGSVNPSTRTMVTNKLITTFFLHGLSASAKGGYVDPLVDSRDLELSPYIIDAIVNGSDVRLPNVYAGCETAPASTYDRDFNLLIKSYNNKPNRQGGNASLFSNNMIDGCVHTFTCGLLPISAKSANDLSVTTIWNETTLATSNATLFAWQEMVEDPDQPWLLALAFNGSNRHGDANITMCGINAAWVESAMWIEPGSNDIAMSNFTFVPHDEDLTKWGATTFPWIHIQNEWANTSNAASLNGTTTPLLEFIHKGINSFDSTGSAWPDLAYSNILSVAIADGLSRIGTGWRADYNGSLATVCREGWCSNGFVNDWIIYNGSVPNGINNTMQEVKSFPQPANVEQEWTRISFPIKRFGYGWGLNTTLVKVAAAILILHAVMILLHCINLILTGQRYSYASSVKELITLAMNSRPSKALDSGQSIFGRPWAQKTVVREELGAPDGMTRYEIVVGEGEVEGSDEVARSRVVEGRTYEEI